MRRLWRLIITLSLGLFLSLAPLYLGTAQTQSSPSSLPNQPTPTENTIDGVPIVLDGQTIWTVKDGIAGFSVQERANAISRRLESIAQNPDIALESLRVKTDSDMNVKYIASGNDTILTVTPKDATVARLPSPVLAEQIRQSMVLAVAQYRRSRQPEFLLRGIVYTLFASIALFICIFAIVRLFAKRIFPVINWLRSRIPSLRIGSIELLSADHISNICLLILRWVRLGMLLVIVYVYLQFVLGLFPWTRPFSNSILKYSLQTLNFGLQGVATYLPNLLTIALIAVVTYYILKLIRPFFQSLETGVIVIPGFYADWAKPTYNLILFLILALAIILAFPYVPGFNSPAFQGVTVFLGILFSLGSTSAVANIVGGVILIYTRAFQIGDRVQIGDTIGVVLEKTLLVTRLRTITNQVLTLPNSVLMNSNVINFSIAARELNQPLILQTTITLGYDLPWRDVHATMISAAAATEHVLTNPAPFVLQTSLDDFYVSYQLNAYIDQPHLAVFIASELHQNIQDKCNEAGLEILSPHYRALRDGNLTTIPTNYLSTGYVPPPFRIQSVDDTKE